MDDEITIAVVAAGPVTRAGLQTLLEYEPGLEVVVSKASLDELGRSCGVDVVVYAAGADSWGQAERIMRRCPDAAWLWLVDEVLSSPVIRLVTAGGAPRGLLPVQASPEEIRAAVRALAEGLSVFHPAFLSPRQTGSQDDWEEFEELVEPLTPREQEVLQQLAGGLTNRQIAVRLGISEHTVKYHISSIYSKLQALNRAEAVQVGIRLGLIGL